jgi:tRNA/rRNA methyltransferase
MDFTFILVEPAVPENIGASARALKTMGFNKLCLVNPCDFKNMEARKLAHGSYEILEKAVVYDSLPEATKGFHFTIGTSAKHRRVKHDYYQITEIAGLVKGKENIISKVGVVFGREERGLDNDELKACDIVSYIPMKTAYPSLNLAQAVMVYAWELSKISLPGKILNEVREEDEFRSLKKKVSEFLKENQINRNQVLYNRIMERLGLLKEEDIHLLHSIHKYLNAPNKNAG